MYFVHEYTYQDCEYRIRTEHAECTCYSLGGGLWNSVYGSSFNGVGSFVIKAGYCITLLQLGVRFIGH